MACRSGRSPIHRCHRHICGVVVIQFCVPLLFAYGAEEERTVEVTGKSSVNFQAAEEAALREAVRQAAGVILHSETEVADFELKRDSIYSRAAGYVRTYQVLAKSEDVNGLYAVKVRASVRTGQIRDDWAGLKMLLERKGRPNLMVVVSASPEGHIAPMDLTAAESALADFFERRCLDLVDADMIREVLQSDQDRASLWDDPKKAAAIGLRQKAGYVLVARLRVSRGEPEVLATNIRIVMARADLQVKLVASDTARLLVTKVANARAGSEYGDKAAQDAVRAAVRELGEPVLYRLVFHWSADLDQGAKIEVLLTRVDLDLVQQIVEALRGARDEGVWVKGAEVQEADAKGVSSLQVWGPGVTAMWLARKVPAVAEGKLKPVRLTAGRIEFEATAVAH